MKGDWEDPCGMLPLLPRAAAARTRTTGLVGVLSVTRVRCGKPTCRCAKPGSGGHRHWAATFIVDGKRRVVESVPAEWVDSPTTGSRTAFKDGPVPRFSRTSAELWVLERRQRGKKRRKRT